MHKWTGKEVCFSLEQRFLRKAGVEHLQQRRGTSSNGADHRIVW